MEIDLELVVDEEERMGKSWRLIDIRVCYAGAAAAEAVGYCCIHPETCVGFASMLLRQNLDSRMRIRGGLERIFGERGSFCSRAVQQVRCMY